MLGAACRSAEHFGVIALQRGLRVASQSAEPTGVAPPWREPCVACHSVEPTGVTAPQRGTCVAHLFVEPVSVTFLQRGHVIVWHSADQLKGKSDPGHIALSLGTLNVHALPAMKMQHTRPSRLPISPTTWRRKGS